MGRVMARHPDRQALAGPASIARDELSEITPAAGGTPRPVSLRSAAAGGSALSLEEFAQVFELGQRRLPGFPTVLDVGSVVGRTDEEAENA